MDDISGIIEHTILKPTTGKEDILKWCTEAADHGFYGVCVPPYHVKQASRFFQTRKLPNKVITVIGFPFGYSSVSAKVEEIKKAIQDGADELDVVVNLAAFLSKDTAVVKNDIQSVVTAAHLQNKVVKIILETGALQPKEMLKLADLCAEAAPNFVKTSTGYYEKGATVEAVQLLRMHLPEKIKIKAAGGIRTREFALDLISAGASRIGTSAGVDLIAKA